MMDKIKPDLKKVGFCRFKKLNGSYLVTNDIGDYVYLAPEKFKDFINGKLPERGEVYSDLETKEFIRDSLDREKLIKKYQERNAFLFFGPSLHIVVVTLRCNFKCVYCQASSRSMSEKGYNMDLKTAKKVVDNVFLTSSPVLTIEFQGGEPLVNWPVVKFITEYSRKKNKKEKKNLFISLVSNLTLLTEERYKFLEKNKVSICTSLDGPQKIHDKNRPWPEGKSYKTTVFWIKKIKKRQKKKKNLYLLSALLTVSRDSLKYPKEIVDEYRKFGFSGIHLRPLSFLGVSGKMKNRVGYSTKEFMVFWKRAMDYIINLNLNGKRFVERGLTIMLKKILTNQDPGFLDLRSPCGAGIGQLLYNYDGKIYTCDEGRMLGDDTFLIGDIHKNSYKEIVSHDTVRSMCVASLLENLPCDNCVYKPYCGVCPVINYALYGDIFVSLPFNEQCELHREMFDYLFIKLENKRIKTVFQDWIEPKSIEK